MTLWRHTRTRRELKPPHTSHKSGHYNATDIITAPPESRWPNDGYHGSSGRKRVVYDDLLMAQWAVGQLSNIYNMKNPDTLRQALLQVILAIKDATSLPWPAVRNPWAASMHEVEDDTLTWGNSTQWALNRLSVSQIAVMNSQAVASHRSWNSGQVTRKVCRYYNEGTCLHESHHGAYRHSCNYCSKQGINLQHPETKCNFKSRAEEKPANTSQQRHVNETVTGGGGGGGGGGGIDNNCNNYVIIKENNNGHDIAINYQDVGYDQSKADVYFDSDESQLCHGFPDVGCGQVDGCSGNIPVNAFHCFDQNAISKNVAGAGSSADNSHITMAKYGGADDSAPMYHLLGDCRCYCYAIRGLPPLSQI